MAGTRKPKSDEAIIFDTQLGARVRVLRKQKKKTQEEVALELGYDVRTIAAIERGQRSMYAYEILDFCYYYDVTPNYLIGLTQGQRSLSLLKTMGVSVW